MSPLRSVSPRRERDKEIASTGAADSLQAGSHMSRRRFIASLGLGVFALVTGVGVTGVYRFEIEMQRRLLEGLRRRVRVVLLTDMHYGPYIRSGSVRAWVDAALEANPELILLGGDIVDFAAPRSLDPLLVELERLSAPLGTYAVWGNHDVRHFDDRLQAFEATLGSVGIRVLRNAGTLVREDVYLAGIDDFRVGRPDLTAALADRPSNAACVLVSHNPDVLPMVPTSVDLTLCGHTHGGQIRLPGIGPLVTSSSYGRRFAAGWVSAPALGYVSRGLGVAQVPLRIDCPAELTVMDLLSTTA